MAVEKNGTKAAAKRWLRMVMVLVPIAGIGGFLGAASGIVPIKASSGHWPITAWFLNFSMARSVSTHTLGMKAPPLDNPSWVLKGAAHYHSGCFPCHGSPELRNPRVAQQMTPHPPYLPPMISQWEPEELFYIVKHGVKFTGMPAWPTQERDDEVWAMTAFLVRFDEMESEEYQRLVHGEMPAAEDGGPLEALAGPGNAPVAVMETCRRCHGVGGLGRGTGAFPLLAGQRRAYLIASLQAFANGDRFSGVMEPVAAGLSDEVIQELANYYSGSAAVSAAASDVDTEAAERGLQIALQGVPERLVPACADCHGPSPQERNELYPELAGQYAEYLNLQLELFKNEHRGGTNYAHVMQKVTARMTPDEMRDAAAYYASLGGAATVSGSSE